MPGIFIFIFTGQRYCIKNNIDLLIDGDVHVKNGEHYPGKNFSKFIVQ